MLSPIGVHHGQDEDVVEVEDVGVSDPVAHQLVHEEGARRRADPFAGVDP